MFAIFGATGKGGGATVRALLARGHAVRVVLHDPRRAGEFAALGCDTAVADLGDAAQIARAARSAEAVQVICGVGETPHGTTELRQVLGAIVAESP